MIAHLTNFFFDKDISYFNHIWIMAPYKSCLCNGQGSTILILLTSGLCEDHLVFICNILTFIWNFYLLRPWKSLKNSKAVLESSFFWKQGIIFFDLDLLKRCENKIDYNNKKYTVDSIKEFLTKKILRRLVFTELTRQPRG